MTAQRIIIIGAGLNGMRAAHVLAERQRRVIIIDGQTVPGGASRYRHIVNGPVLLTGEPGDRGIVVHENDDRMRAELRHRAPEDVEAWTSFQRVIQGWRPWLKRVLAMFPPDPTATSGRELLPMLRAGIDLRRLGANTMMELLRVAPMCVADWLNEYFDDERLKAGLALPALQHTWLGPWSPQSAANLLRLDALHDLARERVDVLRACEAPPASAEVMLGRRIVEILVNDDRVVGVRLDDETVVEGDAVLSTVDPVQTIRRLLHPRNAPPDVREAALHYRTRGTTALLDMETRAPLRWSARPNEPVRCARIVTTLDDLERAFDPVKYRTFPDRPAVEVRQITATRALAIASFIPYEIDGGWSEAARDDLEAAITRTCSDHWMNGEVITATRLMAPADIESTLGHTGGHLDHGELALDQMLIRPWRQCARYRTPIRGLYLGGAGVHPGCAVTGLPGEHAARTLLRG